MAQKSNGVRYAASLTMYYAEIFRISRQIHIFLRIFPYITLKWSDREKFSV